MKKRIHLTLLFSIGAAFSSMVAAQTSSDDSSRWYNSAQVESGKDLFEANCQTCHLKEGRGTDNWQTRDANGKLTPPPLNGTAHTWHHDLGVLSRTIRDGGAKLGGTMPAFAEKLSDTEIAEIIAYVQSLWSNEIFAAWAKSYPEDAAAGLPTGKLAQAGNTQTSTITARLARALSASTAIGQPEQTPVDNLYGVQAGNRYFYLDASGRYLITGDLIDLETGENLTQARSSDFRLDRLAGFAVKDRINYPAVGDEKARITVFTDTTCPYCRRLHKEVPILQKAGVTVSYIPFPRSGTRGAGYAEMRSVWCADDRQGALTAAKSGGYTADAGDCEAADAVDAGYRLGVAVGVTGTPALVLADGRMIPGYQPYDKLLKVLGISTE
ncbi:MAG: hypothetical protein DHS20C01_09940 [marine bacterium B5-7]|nr:MAG: hypothetical protein DHS20C01_09940 [marine bacterium B5-7]